MAMTWMESKAKDATSFDLVAGQTVCQQCVVSPKININRLLGTIGMGYVCCFSSKLQTNLYTSKYKCADPILPTGSRLVSFWEKINSLTRTYFCHTQK